MSKKEKMQQRVLECSLETGKECRRKTEGCFTLGSGRGKSLEALYHILERVSGGESYDKGNE